MYNGEEVLDLHIKESDEEQKRRISEEDWSDFVSVESLVGYNPKTRDCFIVKKSSHKVVSDGDCYIYSLITKSWTFGNGKFYCGANKNITNFINKGKDSNLSYLYDGVFGNDDSEDGSPI